MTIFILQLTSNDSIFEYSFPQEFLHKKYKIRVIRLDGYLEIKSKVNINHINNKFPYSINKIIKTIMRKMKIMLWKSPKIAMILIN